MAWARYTATFAILETLNGGIRSSSAVGENQNPCLTSRIFENPGLEQYVKPRALAN